MTDSSIYHLFFKDYLEKHGALPKVSVCTPTFNRRPFIPALIQCFQNQTYPAEYMEWVVVDDGFDKTRDLFETVPQVKYFAYDQKMLLGKKRNTMHAHSTGDIFVYMDDDDWYPRERVAHSVYMLLNSPHLCAGSSELYLYHVDEAQMYQMGPYGPNHATAGTFAFKRELLQQTRYSEESAVAEEGDFLKNHSIPLVQLNPLHTILVFTHMHNSVDKRMLLKNADIPVQLKDADGNITEECYVRRSSKQLDTFFPRKEEKSLMSFYLTLDAALKQYEPGEVKHKPDVVKQTNEILMKRQMETPIIPLMIDNKPVTLSIQQMLDIVHQLQKRNRELTDMLKTQLNDPNNPASPFAPLNQDPEVPSGPAGPEVAKAENKQVQTVDEQKVAAEQKVDIRIPGTTQVRAFTVDHVNHLISKQHQKITRLSTQLADLTQLDADKLYFLDPSADM